MLKSSITIIVPFLPGEEGYLSSLFYDLRNCPFSFQLILSSPQSFKSFHLGMNEELTHSLNKILEKAGNQFQYVQAGPGRAVQMNPEFDLSPNDTVSRAPVSSHTAVEVTCASSIRCNCVACAWAWG